MTADQPTGIPVLSHLGCHQIIQPSNRPRPRLHLADEGRHPPSSQKNPGGALARLLNSQISGNLKRFTAREDGKKAAIDPSYTCPKRTGAHRSVCWGLCAVGRGGSSGEQVAPWHMPLESNPGFRSRRCSRRRRGDPGDVLFVTPRPPSRRTASTAAGAPRQATCSSCGRRWPSAAWPPSTGAGST
jgi:hypothetical protein